MYLHIRTYSLLLFVVLIAAACAREQAPGGGPRDETPPKLIATVPIDGSTNYRGKSITLEFDEPIKLENLQKEMLITPYIKNNFKTKIRKNRLTIEFEDSFGDSTTYTINMRKAVVDATESNEAEDAKVAFSTGDFIDSLTVSGTITDLMTGEPIENGIFMLYLPEDTLNVQKPYYVSIADDNGVFVLENLKPGEYQAFALAEEDENYEYTKYTEERIAFFSENLVIVDDTVGLKLEVAIYDNDSLRFNRARVDGQYIDLEYNKPLDSIHIDFEQAPYNDSVQTIFVENSAILYKFAPKPLFDSLNEARLNSRRQRAPSNTNTGKKKKKGKKGEEESVPEIEAVDSLVAYVHAFDTLNTATYDTVKFLFSDKRRKAIEEFFITIQPSSNTALRPDRPFDIELEVNKPLLAYNPDSFKLLQVIDTTLLQIDSVFNVVSRDSVPILFQQTDLIERVLGKNEKEEGLDLRINSKYLIDPREVPERVALVSEPENPDYFKKIKAFKLEQDTAFFQVTVFDRTEYSLDSSYLETQVFDTLALPYTIRANFDSTHFTIEDVSVDPKQLIHLDSSAFISVEFDTTAAQTLIYKPKDPEKFGSLAGTVITEAESFVVQLMNNKFEVEDELRNAFNFRFDFVKPGDKLLRVLIDEDGDGEWEKGSFLQRVMPEPVIQHEKGAINIRANWEVLGEVIQTGQKAQSQ